MSDWAEAAVPLVAEFEGCAKLGSGQALHLERALGQVLQECQLNIDAKAGENQVIGFGDTDCRCDQRPPLSL